MKKYKEQVDRLDNFRNCYEMEYLRKDKKYWLEVKNEFQYR